jgi:hypothetical protein
MSPHRSQLASPRTWGAVGLVAQAAFAAGWLIPETWQGPRYSPIADTISDMQAATAPRVWFPILFFALGGIGTFAFAAIGLRRAWGVTARAAPWQIGVAGLALGNSFPLIPCQVSAPGCSVGSQLLSPGGLTDAILAGAALWVLAATPLSLARRLAGLPGWRCVGPVLRLAGVVALASYAALAISLLVNAGAGLTERILVGVCQAWLTLLAVWLVAGGPGLVSGTPRRAAPCEG